MKPTIWTNFSNLFLESNFTCFGQFLCPSSGVFRCTHSNGVCHTGLLCVQRKTPDDGQRNCPKYVEFYSKNKFEKLVHLVGFIIRMITHRFFKKSTEATTLRPAFHCVPGCNSIAIQPEYLHRNRYIYVYACLTFPPAASRLRPLPWAQCICVWQPNKHTKQQTVVTRPLFHNSKYYDSTWPRQFQQSWNKEHDISADS